MDKYNPATPAVAAVGRVSREDRFLCLQLSWFQHIVREYPTAKDTPDDPRWRSDPLAVAILGDIVYHYTPYVQVIDGEPVLCRRFAGEKLLRSYKEWAMLFNTTRTMVRRSVDLLETLGLITKETVVALNSKGHKLPNRLVVEPALDAAGVPCFATLTAPAHGTQHRITRDEVPREFAPPGTAGEEQGTKGGEDTPSDAGDERGASPATDPCTESLTLKHGTESKNPKESKKRQSTLGSPLRKKGRDPLDEMLGITPTPSRRSVRSPPKARHTPAPTQALLVDAMPLTRTWDELHRLRAAEQGKDWREDYERRRKNWYYCFCRLLEVGNTPRRIEAALRRAFDLQWPYEWPGAFEFCFDKGLSDPHAKPNPWRGGREAADNPIIQQMRRESSLEYYYEQVNALPDIPGYESLDDILGLDPQGSDPKGSDREH